jgi:hypothetical protein
MRGKRDGRRRHGLLEQHAFPREPVERRRLRMRIAVRAQPVGSRRVERNHQQVEIGRFGRGCVPPRIERGGADCRQRKHGHGGSHPLPWIPAVRHSESTVGP